MSLFEDAPAKHARDVDLSTPLPLAQQIIAWLIQALGYEPEKVGSNGASGTTWKHARRGRMICRSWNTLVKDVCDLLKLSKDAPEALPGLLREWDGYVSSLRSPPLDVGDRLLPMMRLAVPRLGVRLGAAMALACVVTGKPASEWKWLCDPLAPEVFRTVLKLVLTTLRPDWMTWTGGGKERGKINEVNPKTIRRWDRGVVPGPQNISTLIEEIGKSSEVPLRWARAAMVARRDLEGWVGKEAADSWREAVRSVAMSIGPELATDPRAVPRIAELWTESLADAPDLKLAEEVAGILRLADISITCETVESWLRTIAEGPTAELPLDHQKVRAVLLLSVVLPHPQIVAATYTHLDPQRALIVAVADHRTVLGGEWLLRWQLRSIERREPIRRQDPGSPEERVPITEMTRDAARHLLIEGGTFIRSASAIGDEPWETAAYTLLAGIFGISSAQYAVAKGEAEMASSYLLLDARAEILQPESVVCKVPKFALARARRLASSGDVSGAMETIKSLDITSYEPDTRERKDLAYFLSELAHHALDEAYSLLRIGHEELQSVGLIDGASSLQALGTIMGEGVDSILASSDQLLDAAVRWIAPRSLTSPQIEAVVLSIPYHLRRERLLRALERPPYGAPKTVSLVESLIEHAERCPNDGEVYAMLALAQRLEGSASAWVPRDVEHRCEHLGMTALRDRWWMRIQRDLTSP